MKSFSPNIKRDVVLRENDGHALTKRRDNSALLFLFLIKINRVMPFKKQNEFAQMFLHKEEIFLKVHSHHLPFCEESRLIQRIIQRGDCSLPEFF